MIRNAFSALAPFWWESWCYLLSPGLPEVRQKTQQFCTKPMPQDSKEGTGPFLSSNSPWQSGVCVCVKQGENAKLVGGLSFQVR